MNEIQMEFKDPKPTYSLSLSVVTGDVEAWTYTHNYMSRLAAEWGPYHKQVSVSSVMLNDDGSLILEDESGSYSEATLSKVYNALAKVGLTPQQITEAVFAMQNVGILFRERV